jgi:alpha-glucosidase
MSVPAWWQRGAISQIYPRSFADADGDGVGDLAGIAGKVDYLARLRIEAIWLSPIFTSPMADFGYDVSDYRDVDPLFGTLEDLDDLVARCHARDIKVVLDWVPNHSSDQHPWFIESRASRSSPKRDWYVWRDAPNNWESTFKACGPAWTLDPATGQYYLHSFMPQQPDLNWANPEVRAAMHDVLRFWLDRGIDGFRLDAIAKIAKDPRLRDNVPGRRRHDEDWDSIAEHLQGIRAVIDEYDDRMVVGEVALQDLHRIVGYVKHGDQLHMAHNFVFIDLPYDAEEYRASIDDFEQLAEDAAWPAWFLANHDRPRTVSTLGPERARAVLLMLYALRGTPFIYQGEELGLPDAVIPYDRIVDVDGRDPERAPIPWTRGPGHGFTTGEPWLPFVDAAETLNAQAQAEDPRSVLSLTRRLAELRATTPDLQTGAQETFDAGPDILAWRRGGWTAAVNFALEPRPAAVGGTIRISSDPDRAEGEIQGDLVLAPGEGVLLSP